MSFYFPFSKEHRHSRNSGSDGALEPSSFSTVREVNSVTVAEEAKGRVMVPKMCPIEGLLVCITLDGVAQRDITYDFRTPR